MLARFFKKTQKKAVRNVVLDKGIRLDGRKTTEIRPIWSEVDVLPGTHGSAIFTRGETQAINTVTLGSSLDEQTIDPPPARAARTSCCTTTSPASARVK
jgi:polyribonucleotide nucleotidyltransferase